MSSTNLLDAGSLFAGEVRAYFAPVDRVNGTPMAFDVASMGRFSLDTPPAGWIDAGVVASVKRDTGESWKAVWSGAPAMVKSQGRSKVGEIVEVLLPAWTRLAVALSWLRTCTHSSWLSATRTARSTVTPSPQSG